MPRSRWPPATRAGGRTLRLLLAEVPEAVVTLAKLDLADLASVRTFAETHHPAALDLLVNNAGVMALPPRGTPRTASSRSSAPTTSGTSRSPACCSRAAAGGPAPRVVTVSSTMHRLGHIDFDDLDAERATGSGRPTGSRSWPTCCSRSSCDRRADAAGADLAAVAAHPGYASTNLQTAGPRLAGSRVNEAGARLMNRILGQSAEGGALPLLRAATDPAVRGGEVFGPDGFQQMRGAPVQVPVARRARDRALAERLWTVSEEKTGVRYPALDPA